MLAYLSPKTPAEIVPITFDFSEVIDAVTSVIALTLTVKSGTDASAALMLDGAAQVQGALVLQLLKNGVSGNVYELNCLVASGAERYEVTGQIPIA